MQCFAVTILFFIVNVRGYPIGGDDDITKAIHDYYPQPLNRDLAPKISTTTEMPSNNEDVITFPKDVLDEVFNSPPKTEDASPRNIMISSKMMNPSQNNTDLDKRIPEFFKQLLSNVTLMQTNKNITNSNDENTTHISLDPKVLASIFNTSLPEVQQLMANSTSNGTGTKFETDIRFLTESLLKGAFHNSVEENGVKLRSVVIPPDQSSVPSMGRSVPINVAHEKPTNAAGRLFVPSSTVLLLFWPLLL